MSHSLFIEDYQDRIAFYINGELQFDSQDEKIYHEYLVIPAVQLAIKRFNKTNEQLKVLICGGGDGLAARDILKFPEITTIDLVDYNPEVLELGKTVFTPYNQDSLSNPKLKIHTEEAFEFISELPDNSYHIIIADFTYPNTAEQTIIYSQEWFQEIDRIMVKSGLIAINAFSPDHNTLAFWCLYQTILSAKLKAKPLHLDIPSFYHHGYGTWGFFIASSEIITPEEVNSIAEVNHGESFNYKNLLKSFIFSEEIAAYRHQVMIHNKTNEQLFYYLMNDLYMRELEISIIGENTINFLEINEEVSVEITDNSNQLELARIAKFWVENIYNPENSPDINQLVPVRHHYHSPKMTTSWLEHLQKLLLQIDGKRLIKSLLERSQKLPPQIAQELQNLADKINSNQSLVNLSPKTAEFITLLSVTLLMANLVAPDSVFAKGYYHNGTYYDSSGSDGESSVFTKFFGLMLMSIGGFWLAGILSRAKNNHPDQ